MSTTNNVRQRKIVKKKKKSGETLIIFCLGMAVGASLVLFGTLL